MPAERAKDTKGNNGDDQECVHTAQSVSGLNVPRMAWLATDGWRLTVAALRRLSPILESAESVPVARAILRDDVLGRATTEIAIAVGSIMKTIARSHRTLRRARQPCSLWQFTKNAARVPGKIFVRQAQSRWGAMRPSLNSAKSNAPKTELYLQLYLFLIVNVDNAPFPFGMRQFGG